MKHQNMPADRMILFKRKGNIHYKWQMALDLPRHRNYIERFACTEIFM